MCKYKDMTDSQLNDYLHDRISEIKSLRQEHLELTNEIDRVQIYINNLKMEQKRRGKGKDTSKEKENYTNTQR